MYMDMENGDHASAICMLLATVLCARNQFFSFSLDNLKILVRLAKQFIHIILWRVRNG